jgi:N-formylglutamate deformylase
MSALPVFTFRQGRVPLLVSMPHAGTHIPANIAEGMTDAALRVTDTDWHLDQLYDFLDELGASVLVATHSRYVVDLNRPHNDASLYPGQDTTGLFPVDTFAKEALYRNGMAPDPTLLDARKITYWQPYHEQLAAELARLRAQHGYALLWEAHSIAAVVPRFFAGRLTDFNLGTANGASCGPGLADQLVAAAQSDSVALNGRFKGGYITREYGRPQENIHAVQLELSQATYMEEHYPYRFDNRLANEVRPALRRMLDIMLAWGRALPR